MPTLDSDMIAPQPRPQHGRFYYLHPLLAGPVSGWASHFERCRRMGFDHVVIAPPFLPGRSGNLFVTADHNRLHPALGTCAADTALHEAVRLAREHDLDLVLDIVLDRIAAGSTLAACRCWFSDAQFDASPDPRQPAAWRGSVAADFTAGREALLGWWRQRVAAWIDLGIAGFRCAAAQNAPPGIWRELIAGVRKSSPHTIFMAWLEGARAAETEQLSGCGFDLATSSSWAWDLRSDWLNDDTDRVAAVGSVLAMPELPFGHRLAGTNPQTRHRRAMDFAASFGSAWLMPMGFEFGAQVPLDPAYGTPSMFAHIAASALFDLSREVAELNAGTRPELPQPARLVSPANSRVAAVAWRGEPAATILVNTLVLEPSEIPVRGLASALDGAILAAEATASLAPGEVRRTELHKPPPVAAPRPDAEAKVAVRAPRLAIEAVTPSVDGGRFPVKRIVGATVEVAADIICDGHETVAASLRWRPADAAEWQETPMVAAGNDRWTASFVPEALGRHEFDIEAWADEFGRFQYELAKKHGAGLPLDLELREGLSIVEEACKLAPSAGRGELAKKLKAGDAAQRLALLSSPHSAEMMADPALRPFAVRLHEPIPLDAERVAAGFASWYEIFPRSQSPVPGKHGTFSDVVARLPAIRDMGFDVLYFPPIHPIGKTNRKGRNNSLKAGPEDPGSPYAIGSPEGGHDAVHPELGTLEDFRRLCAAAKAHGLEIALDFAIQCSPDHPWLKQHPEWFAWRPDGSIRYAENPPKRYEDIVNVDFYSAGARPSLWQALRDIVVFWAEQGVRIFRVDNPHTKPFPFWEWMIADVRALYPDTIFLAEAFTRPKVMYRLAKVGFSQSYTYFTWRNTAYELREYLTELTTTAPKDFFRPNFFVNTPDINPEFLHTSGRPGFLLRAALAATLSGLWGVYNGFELCEARSLNGREEYLDSEKYEIVAWDYDRPGNIKDEIRRLNHIRRTNPALQSHLGVTFLRCSNDSFLCYAKTTEARDNLVIVVVSFDPFRVQEGDFELPAELLDAGSSIAGSSIAGSSIAGAPISEVPMFEVENLMRGGNENWQPGWRRLRLDPMDTPFEIWRVRTAGA